MEQKQYTKLGGYWDRKGENEIDLIALNELNKTATIAEIKWNKSNIDLAHLRRKSATLYPHLSEYSVEYKALSMEDMWNNLVMLLDRKLSQNARKKVEESYSEAVVAEQYKSLYQQVLAKGW